MDKRVNQKEIELLIRFHKRYINRNSDIPKTFIGYTVPKNDSQFFLHFMDWWVDGVDDRLDNLPAHSNAFADKLGTRGITLSEFKYVLSSKSDEILYNEERCFQYLFLLDGRDHDYFKSQHKVDEDLIIEYKKMMLYSWERENPLLHHFFNLCKLEYHIPTAAFFTHAMILGGTGSGKSELFKNLWHNMQADTYPDKASLVCIEPSGKLSSELFAFAMNSKEKERTVLLDTDIRTTVNSYLGEDYLGEDYVFVLNPFQLEDKSSRNVNYMTKELSAAVFRLVGEEDKEGQMMAAIRACINLLLELEDTNFKDLRDINNPKIEKKYLDKLGSVRNELRQDYLRDKFPYSRIDTSKNGIYNRVHNIIDDEFLSNCLIGKSTVNLEKEMNSGKVIIFNFTSMHADSIKAFGKLLIGLMLGYAEKRNYLRLNKSIEPLPTYLFIDEMQDFINSNISKILTTSRKYGLYGIFASQRLGQGMNSSLERDFLANVKVNMTGKLDQKSKEGISSSMGGLVAEDFERLGKYEFFSFIEEEKKLGATIIKASENLVDLNSESYMNRDQLKKYFHWLVYDSGYYRKLEKRPTFKKEVPREEIAKVAFWDQS